MATALYFTTVNGQPAKLSSVSYGDINPAKRAAYDKAVPSETGRIVKDGGLRAYGLTQDNVWMEADRVIYRKANPSNHKCDARCRNAKGNNCECSCGGKFHGAGN